MKSAHFPPFRVLSEKVRKVTAGIGPEAERGSARRPPYGGGGPAGGVLLSCLTPHSTFQRVRAGKPPLHSNPDTAVSGYFRTWEILTSGNFTLAVKSPDVRIFHAPAGRPGRCQDFHSTAETERS